MKLNNDDEIEHISLEMLEIKTLQKEFEVLGTAYTMQEKALTKLKAEHETQAGLIKRILQDLELSKHSSYRNKTTRQLAHEAYKQSTVSANWEGLKEHPEILALYEEIKIRSSNEGRRADDVLRKLENQMSVEEFFDQLSKSAEILEIQEGMRAFDSSLGDLRITQTYDRTHANQQDLKQRDKMATMETAIDLIDFLQSEMVISYDGAFIFLMGALAEMGKGQVEEGLRFMLKKPKEPAKEDETETK